MRLGGGCGPCRYCGRSTEAPKHRSTDRTERADTSPAQPPEARTPGALQYAAYRPTGRGPATKAPPTTARRERAPQALLIR